MDCYKCASDLCAHLHLLLSTGWVQEQIQA